MAVSNTELLVFLRVAWSYFWLLSSWTGTHPMDIFFLHLAGLGVGAWGGLLVSVLAFFSNISHELILPLAVIPAPYKFGILFFSPINIWD